MGDPQSLDGSGPKNNRVLSPGREASPPEETPEPSWVDKEDRERRGARGEILRRFVEKCGGDSSRFGSVTIFFWTKLLGVFF